MNIHIVNILLQNIQTNMLWKKVLVRKNCSILGGSPNSARLYKKGIERSIVHFFLYQTKVQVYVIYTAHVYVCIMPFSEVTVLFIINM